MAQQRQQLPRAHRPIYGSEQLAVANQGDNTIVRMQQDGTVVAKRLVTVKGQSLDNVSLNGIAASTDVTTIYATFVDPNSGQGGVLAMPAF